jgi:hypothetical protein
MGGAKTAPAPVGYDPAIIPGWTEPTAEGFATSCA